jgi:sporulation protein YlmC with PRC-barrel domain
MFGKKYVEPDRGYTATLRLPKYYPKEEVLGKVVFDHELDRVGQAVDWTYTSSGTVSLVVSGRSLRGMLKEGDSLFVPFEYIDRVGNFILLSKPIETLIPKEVAIGKEELMEKVAIEKAFEGKFAKDAEKSGKNQKKEEKGLKSINELEKDVIDDLIPEIVNEVNKPAPKAEVKKLTSKTEEKKAVTKAEVKRLVTKAKVKKPMAKAKVKKPTPKARR